jgi:hypothetical protein
MNISAANKVSSGGLGVCGIFKHFSGFEFFLPPNRTPTSANAVNASLSFQNTAMILVHIVAQLELSLEDAKRTSWRAGAACSRRYEYA